MTNNIVRPSWDEYFMQIAEVTKTRADCLRKRVGAVIVRDKRIIATGYNGTPSGIENCTNGGCNRCLRREKGELQMGEQKDTCICIHAEQNAILQAAIHGTSTKDGTMYVTEIPCWQCAKLIINSGIKKIVAKKSERYQETLKLFIDGKVEVQLV